MICKYINVFDGDVLIIYFNSACITAFDYLELQVSTFVCHYASAIGIKIHYLNNP
jgi:hypothetical protein